MSHGGCGNVRVTRAPPTSKRGEKRGTASEKMGNVHLFLAAREMVRPGFLQKWRQRERGMLEVH